MTDTPNNILDLLGDPSKQKKRHNYRIIEILSVLGIVGLLIGFLSPVSRGREAPRRSQCKNNLKQIGLALHNYHDTYGTLPPAYMPDKNGKPLHSWRTLILPFLDQTALYNTIDLSKPWNDPVNAKAYAAKIPIYECPSSRNPENHTTYLAVVTPHSIIRPGAPRRWSQITDGLCNTLMVIEAPTDRAVHWMSPDDADESLLLAFSPDNKLGHFGGLHALLGDGAVRFLSAELKSDVRRALISAAGGEVLGEF